METAKIETNLIAVRAHVRDDNKTKWLIIDCPNGWSDVKKLTKKVLTYQNETYTFMSWNSDTLVCNFKQNNNVARVK